MPAYENPADAENGLTRLLLRAVPPDAEGLHTITYLAKLLNMSRQGIHKWTKAETLAPERVMQIIEISKIEGYDDDGKPILGEPRVKREEFDEFVYKAV